MQIIRKRMITLIEIMIVMFLIALITGVLAYNYQGSLEQGKVFKTQTAMQKLETILNLAVAQDPSLNQSISEDWAKVIEGSPLVNNVKDLEFDGWGFRYRVEKNNEGKIEVISEGLNNYLMKKSGR